MSDGAILGLTLLGYFAVAFLISWFAYDSRGDEDAVDTIFFGLCWPLVAPIMVIAGPFILWARVLRKKGGK